ncbi:hypothetical protein COT97_03855 [Candidatus Falkowbacteria bacterium CG10_big_fil_rev_8_21_14_0_10_39_11]|uniref:Uncharacterized protein n=1 Tax=Candidatus Falkowbacteria bacterium CG10_big_fil_rev_8_21_14_0_10_39_11 TaxID=1974565 RepID=A0A2H0V4F8_9BACT|nr:MAG: hypothetical protein COT97_03855 [Candidatus Falkowbacteria bacterium CG10_big_fil_rev_8_21_14_0_10_39_11]
MASTWEKRDKLNQLLLILSIMVYTIIPVVVLIYFYFIHPNELLRLAMAYISLFFLGLSLRVNIDTFPTKNILASLTFIPYVLNWLIIFFGIKTSINFSNQLLLHGLITFVGLFGAFMIIAWGLTLKSFWKNRKTMRKEFWIKLFTFIIVMFGFVYVPVYALIDASKETFYLFENIMQTDSVYLFILLLVSIIASETYTLIHLDDNI